MNSYRFNTGLIWIAALVALACCYSVHHAMAGEIQNKLVSESMIEQAMKRGTLG